ncbi:MAG: alpha/beta hydrolase [bacterium]|nr:alpha/beta hydrolase [bacterium]
MTQSILDHQVVSERYFFPRKENFENPFMVDCGDAQLGCYYHKVDPDAKTVVFFHGNGEVVADYMQLYIPAFEQMGYNCFLAEYRGYGMSTGTPGLAKMLPDVEHIIKATGTPLDKLILFGRSVGSIYVLEGIRRFPEIAGLIIESGIADMLERVLMRVHPDELGISMEQLRDEVDKELNHQTKLEDYKGSTLILHAQFDSLVNYSHGQRLFSWAPEPRNLKIFDEGDHNDIMVVNFEEYFKLIFEFISGLKSAKESD